MGLVPSDTAVGSTELNGRSKRSQVENEEVRSRQRNSRSENGESQKNIIGTSYSEEHSQGREGDGWGGHGSPTTGTRCCPEREREPPRDFYHRALSVSWHFHG